MWWDWVHLARLPLFGLLYQPRMIDDDDDCGAIGGMRIGRGNRSATLPTTNPTWPAVGFRWVTAWAMARPYNLWIVTLVYNLITTMRRGRNSIEFPNFRHSTCTRCGFLRSKMFDYGLQRGTPHAGEICNEVTTLVGVLITSHENRCTSLYTGKWELARLILHLAIYPTNFCFNFTRLGSIRLAMYFWIASPTPACKSGAFHTHTLLYMILTEKQN
jgi:hypothetical protein